jgi:hypothetical protein
MKAFVATVTLEFDCLERWLIVEFRESTTRLKDQVRRRRNGRNAPAPDLQLIDERQYLSSCTQVSLSWLVPFDPKKAALAQFGSKVVKRQNLVLNLDLIDQVSVES